MEKVKCFISQKTVGKNEAVQGNDMRDTIFNFIRRDHPAFTREDYISGTEFNKIRRNYLYNLLTLEDNDITSAEKEVVDAITNNKILSGNIEPVIENQLTLGERAADNIAEFGGSWRFIIIFFLILIGWVILNVLFLSSKPFDPYPFILLNLILSCLAAIQAPIIMMSQNRVEQKDRKRSENDYKINLKAELEIKLLHEKLDHISFNPNKRLLEVQQMQIEYLDDILEKLNGERKLK